MTIPRRGLSSASLLALTLLGACNCFLTCRKQAQASVAVAVTSVGNWDQYVGDLQPRFDTGAQKLLPAVAPITQRSRDREVTDIRSSTQASIDGFTSPDAISTAPDKSPLASELPVVTDLGELGQDPLMTYHLANRLHQEIVVLNRELQDSVFRDHRPFLVRLNVGLMLRQRQLDADAVTTIAFFPEYQTSNTPPEGRLSGLSPTNSNDYLTFYRETGAITGALDARNAPSGGSNSDRAWLGRQKASRNGIRLIPLSGDSITSASRASAIRRLTDIGIALGAEIGQTALTQRLNSFKDRLNEELSKELNSVFSVTRAGPNSIRVRIGAEFGPGEGIQRKRQIVPRNYSVSLLMLVPERLVQEHKGFVPRVDVVSNTSFYDKDGKAFATPSMTEMGLRIKRATSAYSNVKGYDQLFSPGQAKAWNQLLAAVATNNPQAFREQLTDYGDLLEYEGLVWASMTSALEDLRFSYDYFLLPDHAARFATTSTRVDPITVVGSVSAGSLRVTIPGWKNAHSSLNAELISEGASGPRILASSLTIGRGGREVALEFPLPDGKLVDSPMIHIYDGSPLGRVAENTRPSIKMDNCPNGTESRDLYFCVTTRPKNAPKISVSPGRVALARRDGTQFDLTIDPDKLAKGKKVKMAIDTDSLGTLKFISATRLKSASSGIPLDKGAAQSVKEDTKKSTVEFTITDPTRIRFELRESKARLTAATIKVSLDDRPGADVVRVNFEAPAK